MTEEVNLNTDSPSCKFYFFVICQYVGRPREEDGGARPQGGPAAGPTEVDRGHARYACLRDRDVCRHRRKKNISSAAHFFFALPSSFAKWPMPIFIY